jgi:hypothetical protein
MLLMAAGRPAKIFVQRIWGATCQAVGVFDLSFLVHVWFKKSSSLRKIPWHWTKSMLLRKPWSFTVQNFIYATKTSIVFENQVII